MKRPDLSKRNAENATHGMTKSTTYRSWAAMKHRCLNEKCKDYKNYGGRGINICDEWIESFESFLKDMGEKSKGCSIDRIDNTIGYEPKNCKWSTPMQQARNRRSSVIVECFGLRLSVSEWAENTGLERKTLEYRIRIGWDAEKALTTPSTIKRK
jgi:hypothetical protein